MLLARAVLTASAVRPSGKATSITKRVWRSTRVPIAERCWDAAVGEPVANVKRKQDHRDGVSRTTWTWRGPGFAECSSPPSWAAQFTAQLARAGDPGGPGRRALIGDSSAGRYPDHLRPTGGPDTAHSDRGGEPAIAEAARRGLTGDGRAVDVVTDGRKVLT